MGSGRNSSNRFEGEAIYIVSIRYGCSNFRGRFGRGNFSLTFLYGLYIWGWVSVIMRLWDCNINIWGNNLYKNQRVGLLKYTC